MNAGLYISGGIHGALVLWALIGGVFQRPPDPSISVSEVSIISGDAFEALLAAAPAPTDAPEPEPEPEPQPDPAPDPEPEPEPQSEPEPMEQPVPPDPEPTPQVATQAPPDPKTPEGSAISLAPETAPVPRSAPRIAAQPVIAPEPEAAPAEVEQAALRPETTPEPEPDPQPDPTPSSEEEAVTRTEPDAVDVDSGGTVTEALAPLGSPRPAARPRRPTPQPAAETPQQDRSSAISDALAEAQQSDSQGTGGTGTAPTGPPLTQGERDNLKSAMQKCWNLGALSTAAMNTIIDVRVEMNQDATPIIGSIRLVGSQGDDAGVKQAFEAGRRAIIRCGVDGYPLDPAKFGQWREITIKFDPSKMRLR